MSLLRRRMLMAASMPSGGIETTLQFPLYIYFDYCEETMFGGMYCYGSGDYTELNRVIKFVVETYGYQSYEQLSVDEAKLDELGLEIYVEGEKVRMFSTIYSVSYLNADTYHATKVYDDYIEYVF